MEKDIIKFLSVFISVFHFIIVVIMWYNMPHDDLLGKKMFFIILPSILASLIVNYLLYEILIVINKLAQQIYFYLLAMLFSIVVIFILFPCSQSFCATDTIKEIFYLREFQDKVQISDIFRYEKEPFVQKLIVKKFRLDSYFYNVSIRDTNGVTFNNYKLIFFKDKLYSSNGNLSYKIDNNNIVVENFYPHDNTKKVIYNIAITQNHIVYLPTSSDNNITKLDTNYLSIRAYISKEAIVFHDFGFLSIAANWALL
jgi:hypothetical protein